MAHRKPTVFIGSSSESKVVASAFLEVIQNSGTATPVGWWYAPEFSPLSSTLSALLEACENYDFGLFIFGRDDLLVSRGHEVFTPRDNVFVEIGIFLGKQGVGRVLAAVCEDVSGQPPLKVPSDFAGRTIPRFAQGDPLQMRTSVEVVAQPFIQIFKDWLPEERIPLLRGTSHEAEKGAFVFGIDTKILQTRKKRIAGRYLLPVVLKSDPATPWPENPVLVMGDRKRPPDFEIDEWDLRVTAPEFQSQIAAGERLEFRLFLAPDGMSKPDVKTVNDLFEEGCVFVDGMAMKARGGG